MVTIGLTKSTRTEILRIIADGEQSYILCTPKQHLTSFDHLLLKDSYYSHNLKSLHVINISSFTCLKKRCLSEASLILQFHLPSNSVEVKKGGERERERGREGRDCFWI